MSLTACAGPPSAPTPAHSTTYAAQSSANALAPELGDPERDRLRALAENPDTDDAVTYVVGSAGDVVKVDLEPRRPNGDVEHGADRIRTLVAERLDAVQDTIRDVSARGHDDRPLDQLAAASRTGASTLVLLNSGVTTTDPLDLRVSGWDADPAAFAADLRARRLLPDLTGRDVVLGGLGRTAGRQPPLNLAEQAALHDRWTAICAATGARCRIDDALRPSAPPVSGVDTPVVASLPVTTAPGPGGDVWSVPAALLFRPNTCAPAERQAVARVLGPLADRLRTGGSRVTISGRTAPVGPGDGRDLARCRAEQAARILRGLGVPDGAIGDVRGDGSTADPPSASRDAQGRIDASKLAALRRVVFTVDSGETP